MEGLRIGTVWFMVLGGILFVIFWAAVIALIVWGVHKVSRGSQDGLSSRHNALDIVKERYARGEITREQFEQIKKDLTS